MLGAIIGDVAGSYYEVLEVNAIRSNADKKRSYEDRIKILDRSIPLFDSNSSYTDDTVLTCAIADAILNNKSYEECLRSYGLHELNLGIDSYGRSRFGNGFVMWLHNQTNGDSFGNGCAMRIGPVGYLFDDLETVTKEAKKATIPSHNDINAIRSARIVSEVIFLARNKYSKEEIKKYIEEEYTKLNYDLEDLQRNYRFNSKAIDSVPQALYVFLESNDFEDSIRKAISIGGDTDTIAAIVGSISEAYYGIPEHIKTEIYNYIPDYMLDVINKFYERIDAKKLKYDII